MKIDTVLKLVTQGYKPADIKELNTLGADALSLALNGNSLADVKELVSLVGTEEGEEPDVPATEHPESEEEPDYKKLYEEQKTELDGLKTTIKEIQLENQKRDISGGEVKTTEDQLIDIVSSFM